MSPAAGSPGRAGATAFKTNRPVIHQEEEKAREYARIRWEHAGRMPVIVSSFEKE